MESNTIKMNNSKIINIPIIVLFGMLNFNCNSQESNISTEKDKLTLVSKIALPNVHGRIDHIAYDSANRLAFIAALGNNTVEVVNLNTKKVTHTIANLHEPQGIAYVPSLKKLVVANGDDGNCVCFDAVTFLRLGNIDLKNDADNIRYDPLSQWLYAGYGNGAIAVIDVNTLKKIADITLDGHPESFQISKKLNRVYINVPDANEMEVADLSSSKVIAKWKNITASSNFPMALDENNNRLFIGCRSPAKLRMINAETGKDISVVNCSGDADDVFYYAPNNLVLVSTGKGFIDVFRVNEKELIQVNHIKTRAGARTSLLLPAGKIFLLAVPSRDGDPAALWIYSLD